MTLVFKILFSFTADNGHPQNLKNTNFFFIIMGQSQSKWSKKFLVPIYIVVNYINNKRVGMNSARIY